MHEQVFVIAEAGVNHNGDPNTALELIDAAAASGADAVKFQSFRVDSLVTRVLERAPYQASNTRASGSQGEMLRQLELPPDCFRLLAQRAESRGIEFMSTAFDPDSLAFLVDEVGIRRIKVPSGELTNTPFLLLCARSGLPIILSTGMATLSEVALALDGLAYGMTMKGDPESLSSIRDCRRSGDSQELLGRGVTLLQCTTEYPTLPADVNLRAMATLQAAFGLRIGFSDHSMGTEMSIAATALGATVIEKHLTLDRTQVGPDHRASLEPSEMTDLVRAIRAVCAGLGTGTKEPTAAEREIVPLARKVLVARSTIGKGETFTASNVTAKRAGLGLEPEWYWDLLGKVADSDYQADEPLRMPVK